MSNEDSRAEDAWMRESSNILYEKWVRENEIYVLTPNGKVERVR